MNLILKWRVFDFCLLLSGGIVVLVLEIWGQPFERGFFCDDDSLRYPYREDSVSFAVCLFTGIFMGFATIGLAEFSISTGMKFLCLFAVSNKVSKHDYYRYHSLANPCIGAVIKYFGAMLLGAAFEHITTDTLKVTVGRLRPHFFEVCQPSVGCNAVANATHRYNTNYSCLNSDSGALREIRMSFPSGHTSFIVYCSTYLFLYLQKRLKLEYSAFAVPVLQGCLLVVAILISVSRISDYQHHYDDVIGGAVIGIIFAHIAGPSYRNSSVMASMERSSLLVSQGHLLLVGGGIWLFIEPRHQEFFCYDSSISYPLTSDTVPTAVLCTFTILLPIIFIILLEKLYHTNYHKFQRCEQCTDASSSHSDLRVTSHSLSKPRYSILNNILENLLVFLYGYGATLEVTMVGKITVGRLRPHFLTVCQPDYTSLNCTVIHNPVSSEYCTGIPRLIKEARQSFPSGHASLSMYSMTFLVLLIQYRWPLKKFSRQPQLLRPFLQTIFISLAIFTGLSRISDYKHHMSDVLTGFILGALVAYLLVTKFSTTSIQRGRLTKRRSSSASVHHRPMPTPTEFTVTSETVPP